MSLESTVSHEVAHGRAVATDGWLDRFARGRVLKALAGIRTGQVVLHEAGRTTTFGHAPHEHDLRATIEVHGPAFWRQIALGGALGSGEAYLRGLWSSDDLTALLRIFLANADAFAATDGLWRWTRAPWERVGHWLRDNTRLGSRRNIAAHYDLGNDFYRLMLDETLMYSCAMFESPQQSLRDAQVRRLERMCHKLQLSPRDHLLEIGTGWGGMALYAARHFGCRVTTTTISAAQYEYARRRIAAAGLADRVEVLCRDYRDLRGQYDKLISIEMVEAVGHRWLETFFGQCARLLKPQGQMLLQSITIGEPLYERARRTVDFIKKYIFPGSCIPSVGALLRAAGRASDFYLFHLEEIGPHYAETLRRWRMNFFAQLDRVRELGFDRKFTRMWEFYLCYCEAGFEERTIGDVQMLFTRPACRRAPLG